MPILGNRCQIFCRHQKRLHLWLLGVSGDERDEKEQKRWIGATLGALRLRGKAAQMAQSKLTMSRQSAAPLHNFCLERVTRFIQKCVELVTPTDPHLTVRGLAIADSTAHFEPASEAGHWMLSRFSNLATTNNNGNGSI